ncbi:MAG: thymidine phosphorylase [Gemmataceae bacterium]|nr:thymidine phosphorylase [Gemmata sp.]MDW8196872.1 thymidine phosphorylase [Gemmataceae bacterium]
MRPRDVIRTKRDHGELSPEQIDAFVAAAAHLDGSGWERYHLTALLMAIYLNGLSPAETAYLTVAMANSGRRLDLSDIAGPKVDKHSSGGVGDKTSLILGPLAAACGVIVPMMSGRGLGHTGGTLDKLEAIAGFRVRLSEEEFRTALRRVGLGMIGPTADMAPADRTLYALRDVTATVESIPLITASILSKKLAEGIDGLVMDVKCGRGAFMQTRPEAQALAASLLRVGTANGLRMRALITAMDVPLGCAVGHTLEVIEAIEVLKSRGPHDVRELSILLATRMVELAGLGDAAQAEQKVRAALASGAGLDVFRRCIEQQGGDARVIDDYHRLPTAPYTAAVVAPRRGFLTQMNAQDVGIATLLLGGGRQRADDTIDPAVGILCRAKPGEFVSAGATIYEVHYRDVQRWHEARERLEGSFTIGETPPPDTPLVLEELV